MFDCLFVCIPLAPTCAVLVQSNLAWTLLGTLGVRWGRTGCALPLGLFATPKAQREVQGSEATENVSAKHEAQGRKATENMSAKREEEK